MTQQTWRQRISETGCPPPWWARWVTLVYQGDEPQPMFREPFLTRWQAERRAATARSKHGLGVAVGPIIRIPLYEGPVRAEVARLTDPAGPR